MGEFSACLAHVLAVVEKEQRFPLAQPSDEQFVDGRLALLAHAQCRRRVSRHEAGVGTGHGQERTFSLVAQLFAWRQLVRQGIYLASNPHSSFFYLLTGAHGVHLVGGLLGLLFLWLRWPGQTTETSVIVKRKAATDAVTVYWHFMDALWIYLFLLLFLWR